MTRLRITPDGRIRGLWADEVQLTELGPVHVQRASHVEFDDRLQCWTVRAVKPHQVWRLVRWLTRARSSDVLHQARTRASALAWEHGHFQPGGPYWR